jgi:class 3 adenylate cyclase
MAARLCGEAKANEILVSPRVAGGVEDLVVLEPLPPLSLKGFARPIAPSRVHALKG